MTEPEPTPRRWLRVAGGLLAVVCFAWVLRPIVAHFGELRDAAQWPQLLRATSIGVVAYAALGLILATAWWWLRGIRYISTTCAASWRCPHEPDRRVPVLQGDHQDRSL